MIVEELSIGEASLKLEAENKFVFACAGAEEFTRERIIWLMMQN